MDGAISASDAGCTSFNRIHPNSLTTRQTVRLRVGGPDGDGRVVPMWCRCRERRSIQQS